MYGQSQWLRSQNLAVSGVIPQRLEHNRVRVALVGRLSVWLMKRVCWFKSCDWLGFDFSRALDRFWDAMQGRLRRFGVVAHVETRFSSYWRAFG
jgi:hypothetical protein